MNKSIGVDVCGAKNIRVIVKLIEDGRYECIFDPTRNRGDLPRYLDTNGIGDTEREAIAAYIADVHRREARVAY